MSEDTTLPPTSVGFPFTQDYLVAVFDERAPAERARDALCATGFADDEVALLPPEQVNTGPSQRAARRDSTQRAAASTRQTQDEESVDAEDVADDVADDVAGEAATRHWIMRVHAAEQRQRDQAEALLKRHGAHDMTFYTATGRVRSRGRPRAGRGRRHRA
jgi:hypothetical protein